MWADQHLTLFSQLLFCLGLALVLMRRDMIRMLAGLELMLNAANVLLVHTARTAGPSEGSAMVVFILLVAVCEAAIGLAIFLRAYRYFTTSDTDRLDPEKP